MISKVERDLVGLNQVLRGQAARDDCDELHRALASLRAVLQFLDAHVSGDAVAPLRRLHAALTDVEAGGRPQLLDRPKRAGRPSELFEYELRGMLASALDLLIRSGMDQDSAADWLSHDLRQAGIRKGEIRPAHLKSWRKKASAFEGPQAAVRMLQQLRGRHEDVSSPLEAQRIASLIVHVVARNWPSSETPILEDR